METQRNVNLFNHIQKNDKLFQDLMKRINIYSSSTKIAKKKKIINLDFNILAQKLEVQISKGIIVDNYKNPENNFNYWLFFSFNEILIIDQTNFNENKHFFEKTNSLPSFFYLSEECKRDFLNSTTKMILNSIKITMFLS